MKIAKQGSTLAGVMDALAISVSYGLQYGVPLKSYVHGLTNMAFAPSGITDDTEIRTAASLVDYIFKRLGKSYLSFDDQLELGLVSPESYMDQQTTLLENQNVEEKEQQSIESFTVAVEESAKTYSKLKHDDTAPICYNCGNQTQKAGSCYVCSSCGSTTGCS